MSYDVGSHNYTSNMVRFFRDFGAYPPDWHERPAADVVTEITKALARIVQQSRGELVAKYEPANGWGDIDGAVRFLWDVRDELRTDVSQTVEVSW